MQLFEALVDSLACCCVLMLGVCRVSRSSSVSGPGSGHSFSDSDDDAAIVQRVRRDTMRGR